MFLDVFAFFHGIKATSRALSVVLNTEHYYLQVYTKSRFCCILPPGKQKLVLPAHDPVCSPCPVHLHCNSCLPDLCNDTSVATRCEGSLG